MLITLVIVMLKRHFFFVGIHLFPRKNVKRFLTGCILHFQGKFIRINFDMSGYICGANIETCILCECIVLSDKLCRYYMVYSV